MSTLTLAGRNHHVVRSHNLRAVLNHLLRAGVISRAQLAERTALSNTTITHLIDELLNQGIVVEAEHGGDGVNGNRRIGRPAPVCSSTPMHATPSACISASASCGQPS